MGYMSTTFMPGADDETRAGRFAAELMDAWGVGDRRCNNGVVLLLSVYDRQVFIYGGVGAQVRVSSPLLSIPPPIVPPSCSLRLRPPDTMPHWPPARSSLCLLLLQDRARLSSALTYVLPRPFRAHVGSLSSLPRSHMFPFTSSALTHVPPHLFRAHTCSPSRLPRSQSALTDREKDVVIEKMRPILRAQRYGEALLVAADWIDRGLTGNIGPWIPEEVIIALVLVGFVAVFGGIIYCANRAARRRARDYNRVERLLQRMERGEDLARQGAYFASSCPICLEDFSPDHSPVPGSDDPEPSAPPPPPGDAGAPGTSSGEGAVR